jgi:hypothetical protein
MEWLIIVVAGLFETAFAVLLKQSAHFTRLAALLSGRADALPRGSWGRAGKRAR